MEKELFKELLDREDIKKDAELHFTIKACEIVINKYGGENTEWYISGPRNKDEESNKKTEVSLYRVRNNRIDKVLVICEYNSSKNKKTISTYKSSIPFRGIVGIEVDSKTISINISTRQDKYGHLVPLTYNNEPFEKFHKILIKKFDEYCDAEYKHLIDSN